MELDSEVGPIGFSCSACRCVCWQDDPAFEAAHWSSGDGEGSVRPGYDGGAIVAVSDFGEWRWAWGWCCTCWRSIIIKARCCGCEACSWKIQFSQANARDLCERSQCSRWQHSGQDQAWEGCAGGEDGGAGGRRSPFRCWRLWGREGGQQFNASKRTRPLSRRMASIDAAQYPEMVRLWNGSRKDCGGSNCVLTTFFPPLTFFSYLWRHVAIKGYHLQHRCRKNASFCDPGCPRERTWRLRKPPLSCPRSKRPLSKRIRSSLFGRWLKKASARASSWFMVFVCVLFDTTF